MRGFIRTWVLLNGLCNSASYVNIDINQIPIIETFSNNINLENTIRKHRLWTLWKIDFWSSVFSHMISLHIDTFLFERTLNNKSALTRNFFSISINKHRNIHHLWSFISLEGLNGFVFYQMGTASHLNQIITKQTQRALRQLSDVSQMA
jgi:hypothetical protein